MKKPTLITAVSLITAGAVAAPALAAGHGPTVNVRIEGLSRTLLPARTITLPAGNLSTGGHRYSAATAAGALQSATRGRWTGTWSSSYEEFLVTRILGETDNYSTTKSYWEFFVNGVPASVGINDAKLKAGDRVVFAAVPASAADPELLSLSTKLTGDRLVATVVADNAKGHPVPVKGARVSEDGHSSLTGANGTVSFARAARRLTLTATKSGDVRDTVSVSAG